jgi:plasmid maintenance system antidote protein VapI
MHRALGVDRDGGRSGTWRHPQGLSELLNGKSGISPEMAFRLAKAFGSNPEMWLGLQMDYDLARVQRHARKIRVRKLVSAA